MANSRQPSENDNVNSHLPYGDYGYLPNVAQNAQAGFYPSPHLNPQPVFNTRMLAEANWFTTRVHLSPLGKAFTNDETY